MTGAKGFISMRRLLTILLVIGLLTALCAPAFALDGDDCFEDVTSDNYYHNAVRRAYEWGVMEGTSATTFSPDQHITRGGFLIGLGRAAGINPDDYAGATWFTDVKVGDACAPYALWAGQNNITKGTGGGLLEPNGELTLAQMIVMTARFLEGAEVSFPVIEASAELSVLADTQTSVGAKLSLLLQYGVLLDDGTLYDPETVTVTRAQAASLFVWLNELLWNGNSPVVNDWTEYQPMTVDAVPQVDWPVVSAESIVAVAEENGFSASSTAFQALCAINDYADQLDQEDRDEALVFLFEGAGANANPGTRMNAMCVVVRDGQIVYINRNSSTIPDDPFDPKKNDGMDMPTLRSGIYSYESTNQGYYAALNVLDAQVVRFEDRWGFYESTSLGINIHRRNSNEIAPISAYWGNSVGCCLIGVAGTSSSGEYARFIQSVGLVPDGWDGDSSYEYMIHGKVIVDRSFGYEYLRNVGYSDEALDMIG